MILCVWPLISGRLIYPALVSISIRNNLIYSFVVVRWLGRPSYSKISAFETVTRDLLEINKT